MFVMWLGFGVLTLRGILGLVTVMLFGGYGALCLIVCDVG